jgi:hypothetical protein
MESSPTAQQSVTPQERSNALVRHTGRAQRAITAFHTPASDEHMAHQGVMGLDRIRHAVLWTCWIVTVALITYFTWRAAVVRPEAIDWVALMIRMLVVGSIGLVVETLIEMRLMPWRFLEE